MKLAVITLFVLVVLPSAAPASSEISKHVWGNGALGTNAVQHEIRSTLGQPIVSHSAGSQFEIFAGFWRPTRVVTSVDEELTPPVHYALNKVFPNPFNPQTTVHYTVADGGGQVRIRIFDLRGRLVDTLVDQSETQGSKGIVWNGRNRRDEQVPAGTYLVSMEAPGFMKSIKLSLVK